MAKDKKQTKKETSSVKVVQKNKKKVSNLSNTVAVIAAESSGLNGLQYGVVKQLIKKDPILIGYLEERYRTVELWQIALRSNINVLSICDKPIEEVLTPLIVENLLEDNPMSCLKLADLGVKINWWKLLDHQGLKDDDIAPLVSCAGKQKECTPALYLKALNKIGENQWLSLSSVYFRHRDHNLCKKAVVHWAANARYVPKDIGTEEFWVEVANKNPFVKAAVPDWVRKTLIEKNIWTYDSVVSAEKAFIGA